MQSIVSFRSATRRLVACGALFGAVALGATPALAEHTSCDPNPQLVAAGVAGSCQPGTDSNIHLVVSNPQPSSILLAGTYQLNGTVTDKAAHHSSPAAVDRIQVFVDDPFVGGKVFLSNAQIAPDGTWTATVDLVGRWGRSHLYVVARSSTNGAETTVDIPVELSPLSSQPSAWLYP